MEGGSTKSIVNPSVYVQESNLNSCFYVKDKLHLHENSFSLKPYIYTFIYSYVGNIFIDYIYKC